MDTYHHWDDDDNWDDDSDEQSTIHTFEKASTILNREPKPEIKSEITTKPALVEKVDVNPLSLHSDRKISMDTSSSSSSSSMLSSSSSASVSSSTNPKHNPTAGIEQKSNIVFATKTFASDSNSRSSNNNESNSSVDDTNPSSSDETVSSSSTEFLKPPMKYISDPAPTRIITSSADDTTASMMDITTSKNLSIK
jgi:hypothetical protein